MERRTIIIICVAVTVIFAISLTLGLVFGLQDDEDNSGSDKMDNPMLLMLDAMEILMTGGGEYDREYYSELRTCMDTIDPRLGDSQDAAWYGVIDYWNSNGTEEDRWGSYMTKYMEQNATISSFLGMIIYEPCNYASNLAYYKDVTEFCLRRDSEKPMNLPNEYVVALGKAYSALAFGSSFMHGTHTEVGHQQDARCIDVIAYIIHQGCFLALSNVSSIVTDLKNETRPMQAIEIAEDFLSMYLNKPVYEWHDHIDTIDMPNYYLSFAGIISTIASVGLEETTVDALVPILADIFGLSDQYTEFITDQYLPELRKHIQNLNLGPVEKTHFIINSLGAIGKLIYAMVWQEEVLVNSELIDNATFNEMGWEFLPRLNSKINELNSFEYHDLNYQDGINVYPGEGWCNPLIPHSKWHLEAGIGLLDLTYVGDEIYRIFSQLS